MSAPLDDRYFEWLYSHIGAVRNRNPARSHWHLARQLYVKEFVWLVPNDDNRVEDGRDLRYEFINETGADDVDPNWMGLGCSMLEMLIALSRRASFEHDAKTPDEWFGLMLHNIGLDKYSDARYSDAVAQDVDETLDRVIYRTYDPTGHGGLFPLSHTFHDQRKVELWYQLAEYLLEEFPL